MRLDCLMHPQLMNRNDHYFLGEDVGDIGVVEAAECVGRAAGGRHAPNALAAGVEGAAVLPDLPRLVHLGSHQATAR